MERTKISFCGKCYSMSLIMAPIIAHNSSDCSTIWASRLRLKITSSMPMRTYYTLLKEACMKKSELLHWLQEEYQQWEAFLDQLGPARTDQPGVNGGCSMKASVAHLTGWQPRLIASMQAAQRGEGEPPPPWPAHLQTDDEINAWIYESNRGRSVREVLDESYHLFQQLLAVIEGLPDEVQIDEVRHDRAYYLV